MKRVLSMYKRNWIIILIVIVMTILNPTYSDFKEYTGLTGKDSEHLHKKYNFLILSIYKNDVNEHNYLAILMNFIDITQHKINTESIVTKIQQASQFQIQHLLIQRICQIVQEKLK